MSAGFRFKQFTVNHDKCAMKVGTDGVLLGSWASAVSGKPALDAGCGSGLIALMLAQRGCSPVHAVEIDQSAYEQCLENFSSSKWSRSLAAYHGDYREFNPPGNIKYQLIASNPPFFNNSLKGISAARNSARHTDDLPWNGLIEKSASVLEDEGLFSVIIPFIEHQAFLEKALGHGFHLSRRTAVIPREGKQPERALLEFSKKQIPLTENTLTILDSSGKYTGEYVSLTKDFYLNF